MKVQSSKLKIQNKLILLFKAIVFNLEFGVLDLF